MTATAILDLQAAVVARLRDAAFAFQQTGCPVLDAVPELQGFPYAVFDTPFETPERTLGQGGHSVLFNITIMTRDGSVTKSGSGSSGWKPGSQLADALIATLVDPNDGSAFTPLVVANHTLVDLDYVSIDAGREDDGMTRHIDVQFEAHLDD